MAPHLWLLPWLALTVGMAALLLGLRADRAALLPRRPPILPSFYAVWLFTTAILAIAMMRLGASGADFVTVRGAALGALSGWALCEINRRRSGTAAAPIIFGVGTVTVTLGRLWLTHGEISGLTGLSLGAALAVLCLSIAPALFERAAESDAGTATIGLLYLTCLGGAVEIGFGRAAALQQEFWADIPLLLGACLALGSATGGRLGRPMRFWPALFPLLLASILILLPLMRLAPSWRPLELTALGAIVFGVLARLGRGTEDRQTALAGFVMLAAGSALAFALWSGYGLALLVLGGWLAVGSWLLAEPSGRAGRIGMGFAAVLLVYRLATLQNSPAVHASGPGDIWDLFAVCLGALLPLLAAEWASTDSDSSRLARWLVLLQWLLALIVPALLLDYIWQPRSVAGILLGTAVGLLLAGSSGSARQRQEAALVSGLLFSLILFQFLPLIQHVNEPTRAMRVGLVLLGAALLVLRLLATGSGPALKETDKQAEKENDHGALKSRPRV